MHDLAPLIYDLAIMLGLAAIVVLLCQRIKQPVVLGYLIAGIIVGPYTPPYVLVNDIPNIKILSELGVIFLMFSLGLQFSFKKLAHVGFSASLIGLCEVILMLLIGFAAGEAMGWSYFDSLFLGAALAISSTTIIIKAIDELGLKTKKFAQLIFGVLIVEDLLAVILLVILSTIVTTNQFFSYTILWSALRLIIVVVGWVVLGYFLLPPLFRRVSSYISEETLTIVSVALCLLLVSIAAKLHYSAALGVFIMGSILAETSLAHRIEQLVRPIRDIFAAVFFISVGMLIDPSVIYNEWSQVLCIAILTIVGKLFSTSSAAFLTGQNIRVSIQSGFSMAQVGEFSFIIAALGVALGATTNHLYPLIVAVSGITTFTTPYLIRASGPVSTWVEKRLPESVLYFLRKYTAWVNRARASSKSNPRVRAVFARLMVNGIMVAILFTVMDQYLLPMLPYFREETWHANTLSLLIALIVSSPFIWGMLFSFRKLRISHDHPAYLNPAAVLISLLTFSEITLLGLVYFNSWLTVVLFALIAVLFFLFLYKQLERSYRWFELQLIHNVSEEEVTEIRSIVIHEDSPMLGLTIEEVMVRELVKCKIVGLTRGHRRLVDLDKQTVLCLDDVLLTTLPASTTRSK